MGTKNLRIQDNNVDQNVGLSEDKQNRNWQTW